MMLQKNKPIRLSSKGVKILNDAIFARDDDKCILCHAWVNNQEKFHHAKKNGLKSDVIEEGVVLCMDCHKKMHDTGETKNIKHKIIRYLSGLYPTYWGVD